MAHVSPIFYGPGVVVSLLPSVTVGATSFAIIALVLLLLAGFAISLYRRLAAQARDFAESREQLQLILDNLTEGIVVIDEDEHIVQMNKTAAHLLSAPDANRYYNTLQQRFEVFTPDGTPLPPQQWPSARALRGDFVQRYVILLRDKVTGETSSREINTVLVPQRPGGSRKIIISFRDDTARLHADEARTRLGAIVESSEDAIIGMDARGNVTSWNKGAETIFGYSAAEMIGKSIYVLTPPDHPNEEEDVLQRVRAGETVIHFNTTRLTKSGRAIHVSLTISPIRDAQGNVIGYSKIARNITETLSLERQLLQSQKMEAIGQLTGGIAHDFNNLLGIVIGNLDLLAVDIRSHFPAGHDAVKRANAAQKAALRGADFIRRLLAFSSNEQLNPAPIDLAHAIRNTLELATRALGPEITVLLDLEPNLPAVFADVAGFEGALLNLIVNARDAMPNGGTLRIASASCDLDEDSTAVQSHEIKAGRYACVNISDDGEGMTQEVLDRAFEPFFTTKGVGRGTGLGLASVYGFLKQSNGTARIYSEPGYGTKVTLYLPFADQTVQPEKPVPQTQPTAKIGGTILLVDDEADLLDIATTYLTKSGYSVLQAKDGAAAIDLLTTHVNIDIMVTDIIMPGGMNGVELGQAIGQLRPELKIIYTSGFPADALAQKNLAIDGGTLLHKPYRLSELGTVIHKSLDVSPSA
jgi:PAS domain S-box-containing protein